MMDKINYESYIDFLEGILSPERLRHSLGVMQVMLDLSPIYSLNPEQAMIAGLLHDAAKDLSHKDQLALAKEANIQFRESCESLPIYLHAPVGAYLIGRDLNIYDSQVLGAIAAHSFSDSLENLNAPLSQCLRFADLLAPITMWKGMKKFKSVVYSGKADEASLLQYGWLIEFFQEKQVPIHSNVTNQFRDLSDKIEVSGSFFDRW